ncbi:MAG: L-threonylcarbamoyladenylate synthase, partial [Saprospiraceae bacterium]
MDTKIGSDLSRAVHLLNDGYLVGIPTETVYGLAGNALNPAAVASIFEAKNRPSFDPLIVHISDATELTRYALTLPEAARRLASLFWPGPLTLLLPRRAVIPDLVTSGLDRVALRVPAHEMALQLLQALDFPLAAPSANPFGYVSPTTAQHVVDQLGGRIPYVLDGGACAVGLESTIVGFEADGVVVYRLGG